eukprot:TRINITY_DN2395_c0_g1_i1.p4 TRINITY_DN2395_c0_g1~~TRINITY_DN2395_c0_g1_i1.p4  ORF type:complete len:113 (+),score=25.59 TRINITY_DN2395_c0_g1_i1:141-479(+)
MSELRLGEYVSMTEEGAEEEDFEFWFFELDGRCAFGHVGGEQDVGFEKGTFAFDGATGRATVKLEHSGDHTLRVEGEDIVDVAYDGRGLPPHVGRYRYVEGSEGKFPIQIEE